jgi:hypothetical protein
MKHAIFFILMLYASIVGATTNEEQLKIDKETLSDLFSRFELYASDFQQCGLNESVTKMLDSVEFIEASYLRLNSDFPQSEPPIREQMQERMRISCLIFRCKNPPDKGQCKKQRSSREYTLGLFKKAVDNATLRLNQVGVSALDITGTLDSDTGDCMLSAQYYQDAYVSRLRTNDLICFKKALTRELQ